MLGCGIAIGGSNRIVVGSIDRHHYVLTSDPRIIMVIDEDRRGDREAFANAEEVEVLVDNVVVPVDLPVLVLPASGLIETAASNIAIWAGVSSGNVWAVRSVAGVEESARWAEPAAAKPAAAAWQRRRPEAGRTRGL